MLDSFISSVFIPTITKPTQITHNTSTLIDNLYIKIKQPGELISGILSATADVIRPQTDSDKSSVALETSVVGAIGMGAPRSQTGVGGGGAEGTVKDFIVDTGFRSLL